MCIKEEENNHLNSLEKLLYAKYINKENMDDLEFQEKYLPLVNKMRETGNYCIFQYNTRYLFEILEESISVIDLVSSSNNVNISYDKMSFSTLPNGNYALIMSVCGFEITKEDAYALYNIIKMKQMKYPYKISKTYDDKCYSIIDSSGNELAFFNTHKQVSDFYNSSLTNVSPYNDLEAFLND